MCKLRDATVEDWEAISNMLMDMQDESPFYSQFESDGAYFVNTMEFIKAGEHFAKVITVNEKVVGVMLGICNTIPFVQALCATELVIYVNPEHRGGRAAYQLIRAFEEFAIEAGAVIIFVGVSAEIEPEKVGNMYMRLDYSLKGTNYMKRLN